MGGDRGSSVGASVLVVDPSGIVFSLLRSAKLGIALWRITDRAEIPDLAGIGLAVVASYDRPDWALVAWLVDQTPTVIVTSAPDGDEAGRAIALGASGYVPAALAPDAMRRAILGALRGEPAFSRRLLAERLRLVTKPQFSGSALVLTARQREVVILIARGAADKEIGRTLGITTATAQKHVTNVLKRLNVPNRAAAAAALVSSTTWHSSASDSLAPRTVVEAAAS